MVKLFNRNKDTSANDDIKEYVETEQRERKGVAWILGIATLIATFLLALGVFYGGRWAYREIFDDQENGQVADEDQDQELPAPPPAEDGDDLVQPPGDTDEDLEQPTTVPGDDTDEGQSELDQDNQSQTRDDSNQDTPAVPATGVIPATGGSSEDELR